MPIARVTEHQQHHQVGHDHVRDSVAQDLRGVAQRLVDPAPGIRVDQPVESWEDALVLTVDGESPLRWCISTRSIYPGLTSWLLSDFDTIIASIGRRLPSLLATTRIRPGHGPVHDRGRHVTCC